MNMFTLFNSNVHKIFVFCIFLSQFFIEGSRTRSLGNIKVHDGALIRGVPSHPTNTSLLNSCLTTNATSQFWHSSYRLNDKHVCNENRKNEDALLSINSKFVAGGALAQVEANGFRTIGNVTTKRGYSNFVKTTLFLAGNDSISLICIDGADSYENGISSFGSRNRIPCISIAHNKDFIAVMFWNALDEPEFSEMQRSIRLISRTGVRVTVSDPPADGDLASAVIKNWLFTSVSFQECVAGALLFESRSASVPRLDHYDVTEIRWVALILLSIDFFLAVIATVLGLIMPKPKYKINTYNNFSKTAWESARRYSKKEDHNIEQKMYVRDDSGTSYIDWWSATK